MDNKVIVPWDEKHGDSYVPKYIKKRAKQALKQYPFSVKKMRLITTKPDKGGAIWKLQTSSGPKSLKLLHRRPTRSLFSLEAQNYLTRVQNANAPSIVKTKKGADYIELGGKLWFVAEWIEPLKPVSKDLKGAKKLCSALGRFHRLSKGYVPPAGSEVPSRLYKWPKKYEKIIEKMDWFRNIAKAYPEKRWKSIATRSSVF